MEEENNKYERGKIYKIFNDGYNECYIGSTCNKLSQRMALHREKYKKWLETGKGLCTSFYLFNTYGVDICKIELVEEIPCKNIHQLRQREGFYIRTTECVNKRMEGRTKDNIKQFIKTVKRLTPEEKAEKKEQKRQELRHQIIKELETKYNIDLPQQYINNNNENIEFDDNLFKQIKNTFHTRTIKPLTYKGVIKLYVRLINYLNGEKIFNGTQLKTKENRYQTQYIRISAPQHMAISEDKILKNELDN